MLGLPRPTPLIWKFADQKVNGFGPAHIEKLHFDIFFILIYMKTSFLFTIKDRSAIYLVKKLK
jgi:hypothetical protein